MTNIRKYLPAGASLLLAALLFAGSLPLHGAEPTITQSFRELLEKSEKERKGAHLLRARPDHRRRGDQDRPGLR